MIFRDLTDELVEAASHFPVVGLLGPRQSGKTTLVQTLFKKHKYVSLEDMDNRFIAQSDPRSFSKIFQAKRGSSSMKFNMHPNCFRTCKLS